MQERQGKGTPATAQRVTETPPTLGMTATPWLRGENHPKPCTKFEHEQDNRIPSSSQPPFWVLPFCLSNFTRGADTNFARRHCSEAEAAESPPPGTGHPVSPLCTRAGAAPTWGSWSPASCWPVVPALGLPPQWRGAPSRDGSFMRSVRHALFALHPHGVPIPAPTFPLPHSSLPGPTGPAGGAARSHHTDAPSGPVPSPPRQQAWKKDPLGP